jgi:hypothetical protein
MDHVGYKVVQRLAKKRRLIAEPWQAAAMKVKTMPPVPDEFPCLSSQIQGCPSILLRHPGIPSLQVVARSG